MLYLRFVIIDDAIVFGKRNDPWHARPAPFVQLQPSIPLPGNINCLAAGAAMLRDLTADAWAASEHKNIGCPALPVTDVETGKIVVTRSTFGGE